MRGRARHSKSSTAVTFASSSRSPLVCIPPLPFAERSITSHSLWVTWRMSVSCSGYGMSGADSVWARLWPRCGSQSADGPGPESGDE
eukprot:3098396-Rhodomonas_salina.1